MIRIVTESMSDFTQEEAKAADLIVMPLPIRFGMEEYWDDGGRRKSFPQSSA